jgi:hypothetical protein
MKQSHLYLFGTMPKRCFKKAAVLLSMLLLLFLVSAARYPLASQPTSTEDNSSRKSNTVASIIALSSTTFPVLVGLRAESPAGLIMFSGGLVFGPFMGYVYMENASVGLRYAGTRALIFGGTIGSVQLICALGDCSLGLFGNDSGSEFDLAVTVFLVGFTATLMHNLYDTFSIGSRVERRGRRLAIVPAYFPEQRVPGIRVMQRF